MEAFEFKAQVKNGFIQIPQRYSRDINNTVKVIVLADRSPEPIDMVAELMEHPLHINDFIPLKRDNVYERP